MRKPSHPAARSIVEGLRVAGSSHQVDRGSGRPVTSCLRFERLANRVRNPWQLHPLVEIAAVVPRESSMLPLRR
jgi:hypothetical protein